MQKAVGCFIILAELNNEFLWVANSLTIRLFLHNCNIICVFDAEPPFNLNQICSTCCGMLIPSARMRNPLEELAKCSGILQLVEQIISEYISSNGTFCTVFCCLLLYFLWWRCKYLCYKMRSSSSKLPGLVAIYKLYRVVFTIASATWPHDLPIIYTVFKVSVYSNLPKQTSSAWLRVCLIFRMASIYGI